MWEIKRLHDNRYRAVIALRQSLPSGNRYPTFTTGQSLPNDNRYRAIATRQSLPDNRYRTIATGQSLPDNRYPTIATRQSLPRQVFFGHFWTYRVRHMANNMFGPTVDWPQSSAFNFTFTLTLNQQKRTNRPVLVNYFLRLACLRLKLK